MALNHFSLERASAAVCSDRESLRHAVTPHVFRVVTCPRVYYLCAPSAALMRAWIDAMAGFLLSAR